MRNRPTMVARDMIVGSILKLVVPVWISIQAPFTTATLVKHTLVILGALSSAVMIGKTADEVLHPF